MGFSRVETRIRVIGTRRSGSLPTTQINSSKTEKVRDMRKNKDRPDGRSLNVGRRLEVIDDRLMR